VSSSLINYGNRHPRNRAARRRNRRALVWESHDEDDLDDVVFTEAHIAIAQDALQEDLRIIVPYLQQLDAQVPQLARVETDPNTVLCERAGARILTRASVATMRQAAPLRNGLQRLWELCRTYQQDPSRLCGAQSEALITHAAYLVQRRLWWLRQANPVHFNAAFLEIRADFASHPSDPDRAQRPPPDARLRDARWQSYLTWCERAREQVTFYRTTLEEQVRQLTRFAGAGRSAAQQREALTQIRETLSVQSGLGPLLTQIETQMERLYRQRDALAALRAQAPGLHPEAPAVCMEMLHLLRAMMELPAASVADRNAQVIADDCIARYRAHCDGATETNNLGRRPGGGPGGGSGGAGTGGTGISGVMADPSALSARPTGYSGAQAARRGASAQTQARFFQYGVPIADDVHNRRFNFGGNGYVHIQAYRPARYSSSRSEGTQVGIALGLGVLGVVSGGIVAAGVAGSAALGTVGAGLSTALITQQDGVWQGYRATYYNYRGRDLGSRYFYGWKESDSVWTTIDAIERQRNPDRFPDFADLPASFQWSPWRSESASKRSPERTQVGQRLQEQAAFQARNQVALTPQWGARLVEAMAALTPQNDPVGGPAALRLPAMPAAMPGATSLLCATA